MIEEVYSFSVSDHIEEGATVYVLYEDELGTLFVDVLNNMTLVDYLKVRKLSGERKAFFYEVKKPEVKVDE